jgi:hypothetical protein
MGVSRGAGHRHCAIQGNPGAIATTPVQKQYFAVPALGIALLTVEALTFSLNSGVPFKIMQKVTSPDELAQSAWLRWQRLKWVWPFDGYPSFVGSFTEPYVTWEPRLVYADGAESAIPAKVWALSFGDDASVSEANAFAAGDAADPLRRKSDALMVARMLWKHLPRYLKRNAVAMRGYRSVFSTDPDHFDRVSAVLLDSFPASLLATAPDGVEPRVVD